MTDSSTFKITIIGLMILAGAINTIGLFFFIQLINFKIGRLYMKGPIINISFILTCKRLLCFLGSF